MPEVQVTVAVARVLREFLSEPSADRYGYELMRATSFPSGKLYPILTKLVRIGWLSGIPKVLFVTRWQPGAGPGGGGGKHLIG
jgi:hypothetical protein